MDHFVATVDVIVAAVLHLKYIYLCIFCKARILPALYTVLVPFDVRATEVAVVVVFTDLMSRAMLSLLLFMLHCARVDDTIFTLCLTLTQTHSQAHTHTHTYSATLPVRYKAKDIAHTPRCSFMSTSVRLAVPLSSCRHHKSFEVA